MTTEPAPTPRDAEPSPDAPPRDEGITEQPSDNTTLTGVVETMRDAGYTADMWAEEEAAVRCGACDTVTPAGSWPQDRIRRLEGASDPADMVAVVATVCPHCSASGTLVLSYGPMASPTDAAILVALPDAR